MISVAFTLSPAKIGYAPYQISVTDTTEEQAEDPITSKIWTWGDGQTSTETNHTYTAPGVYNLCLTVTTASGKTATSAIIPVTVISKPATEREVMITDLKGIYTNVIS